MRNQYWISSWLDGILDTKKPISLEPKFQRLISVSQPITRKINPSEQSITSWLFGCTYLVLIKCCIIKVLSKQKIKASASKQPTPKQPTPKCRLLGLGLCQTMQYIRQPIYWFDNNWLVTMRTSGYRNEYIRSDDFVPMAWCALPLFEFFRLPCHVIPFYEVPFSSSGSNSQPKNSTAKSSIASVSSASSNKPPSPSE